MTFNLYKKNLGQCAHKPALVLSNWFFKIFLHTPKLTNLRVLKNQLQAFSQK